MSFFEDAAFASMFDPSSTSSASDFLSFSSLADLDVSSLASSLNPKKKFSMDESLPIFYAPSSEHSSPMDGLSLSPASLPTQTYSTPPAMSLPTAGLSLSGMDGLDVDFLQSGMGFDNYGDGNSFYDHPPALSNKSSIESFSSSNGSEFLLTPKQSFSNYSWDDLSTPASAHSPNAMQYNHGLSSTMLPGQSPAQPHMQMVRSVSMGGKLSPRRDRALNMKTSMPTMMEHMEDDGPQNFIVSYGMNISKAASSQGLSYAPNQPVIQNQSYEDPSYNSNQVADEISWAFDSNAASSSSSSSSNPAQTQQSTYEPNPVLVPAAQIVNPESQPSGWSVNVPTFASQNAFDEATSQYGAPEFAWNPTSQNGNGGGAMEMGGGEQVLVEDYSGEVFYGQGRPLTSDAAGSMMLAPPMQSQAMRKARSTGGFQLKKQSQQMPKDLFAFQPMPSTPVRPMSQRRASQPIHGTQGQELFGFESYGQRRNPPQLSVQINSPAKARPYPSVLAPPMTPDYQVSQQEAYSQQGFSAEFDGYSTPTSTPMRSVQSQQQQPTIYPMEQMSVQSYQNGESSRYGGVSNLGNKRKISMASASVMQPAYPMARSASNMSNSGISGWTGGMDSGAMNPQALENSAAPVLTTAPLVHSYSAQGFAFNAAGQPMAPLPNQRRRSSKALPKPRTPSASKRGRAAAATPFSAFVNFTAADADKLLTGVAPSGSQKRRRENSGSEGDDGMNKRSRSD